LLNETFVSYWRRSIVVRTLVSAGELSLSCIPDC